MSYFYNNAALFGGASIADALASLSTADFGSIEPLVGGWEFDDADTQEAFEWMKAVGDGKVAIASQNVTNMRDLNTLYESILDRYDVDPAVLQNLIFAVFLYDSFLMKGDPTNAHILKAGLTQGGSDGRMMKAWNYVRNKAHKFGTKPLKRPTGYYSKDARDARRKGMLQVIANNRAALLKAPSWVGSSGYIPQSRRTQGLYKYLATGVSKDKRVRGLSYFTPLPLEKLRARRELRKEELARQKAIQDAALAQAQAVQAAQTAELATML